MTGWGMFVLIMSLGVLLFSIMPISYAMVSVNFWWEARKQRKAAANVSGAEEDAKHG
jgi:hypothetical protein